MSAPFLRPGPLKRGKLPKPIKFLVDTKHFDSDSAYVACMMCDQVMTMRLDDILGNPDGSIIVVHDGYCLSKARSLWGNREVI